LAINAPAKTMLRYILSRSLAALPLLWLAITALFVVFLVVPGDPVSILAAEQPLTPEVRRSIEEHYGLDKPVLVRYGTFFVRLLQGDLGESYVTGRNVGAMVLETLPASMRLAFWAIVIEIVLGVGSGVLAATLHRSTVDMLLRIGTLAVMIVPAFLIGIAFQYLLGILPFKLGWPEAMRFPVQGIGPDTWFSFLIPVGDQWRYLLLPAITLACVTTAVTSRLARTSMIETLQADFIRTLKAMGIASRRIVLSHALRNAIGPVIAFVAVNIGRMLGSAVLVETIFGWPGMGSSIQQALALRDAPVVMGFVIVLVLAFLFFNLAADLIHGAIDPRVRTERAA
jgi:ABC-type dipeptide/oligopeptide/nickel transport system permease component